MPVDPQQTIYYKRARFTTRLPVDRKYAQAHFWLSEDEPGILRIGMRSLFDANGDRRSVRAMRHEHLLCLLLAVLSLGACATKFRRGVAGDSCTATNDCESGLSCVAQLCIAADAGEACRVVRCCSAEGARDLGKSVHMDVDASMP